MAETSLREPEQLRSLLAEARAMRRGWLRWCSVESVAAAWRGRGSRTLAAPVEDETLAGSGCQTLAGSACQGACLDRRCHLRGMATGIETVSVSAAMSRRRPSASRQAPGLERRLARAILA